jgi:streptogramin lyase
VAVDGATNVYVADGDNDAIRKITPAGVVTTLAGNGTSGTNDGTGSAARFQAPEYVAVDSAGNLYVADTYNFTIRKVTPVGASWVVTTVAGLAGSAGTNDGTGSAARFYYPEGVAVDSATNVYVADGFNDAIRKLTPAGTSCVVTTLAGRATGGPGSADGTGSAARFNVPFGVSLDSATNIYVADSFNSTIRKVTPAGVVTTLAGLAGVPGSADGTNSAARFNEANGVAVDTNGNVYVADWGNHTIRKVTPVGTNWVVTTLAGKAGHPGLLNGTGTNAEFDYPNGVAVDTNGNVYVADTANAAIRKVTPAGVVTTLSTDFSGPAGVAVDTNGNVYVADYYSYTIRKVTSAGVVTILAGLSGVPGSADGTNSAARFNYLRGVAVDSAGNLYVADTYNFTIRKVTPVGASWVVTTLAGWPGSFGGADGTGSAAGFYYPGGVAVDSAGNLYVASGYNNTMRKGFPASSVPAPNLQPPSLSAGQFGFAITGLPGLAVNIESSGDLSQWQVVGTVILEGGTNSFVTTNPPPGTQFYRGHVR